MKNQRIWNIIFWSVISAAFIGPGTVTTAAKSGASYGAALLWALIFSVVATMVLQEMAARLTIATGRNLGEHIRDLFGGRMVIPTLIWLSIAFGCAAYEAGNIMGAVAGLDTIIDLPRAVPILIIVALALVLLATSGTRTIARLLGVLVAIMGVVFIMTSLYADLTLGEIVKGALVPGIPAEALILVIGLVGTTVVPYNLFLGSGIGQGQTISSMRQGLIPAIAFGGIISLAIMFSGTLVDGQFSFTGLSNALSGTLGSWAKVVFGLGLLAAGFTSAVTAPLAAAITARSIFPGWQENTWRYRAVWIVILVIGAAMSLLGLRPVAVIVAAQALNGVLLPLVAISLLYIVLTQWNKSAELQTGRVAVYLAIVVVAIATALGIQSLLTAIDNLPFIHLVLNTRLLLAGMCGLFVIGWSSRLYIMRNRTISNRP